MDSVQHVTWEIQTKEQYTVCPHRHERYKYPWPFVFKAIWTSVVYQNLWLPKLYLCDGPHLDDDVCVFFSMCFPKCLTVNLNMYPLTVCNHMDAVIMFCDWAPDPHTKVTKLCFSVKLCFGLHNYIIVIRETGRCPTVSLTGRKVVLWRKVQWSLGWEGWPPQCFFSRQ